MHEVKKAILGKHLSTSSLKSFKLLNNDEFLDIDWSHLSHYYIIDIDKPDISIFEVFCIHRFPINPSASPREVTSLLAI